jgi:hypothetical protein
MKWRSKITGATYNIGDAFRDETLKVAVFKENDDWEMGRPIAILSQQEFLNTFEKVEDEKVIQEGIYDGWDTE